MIGFLSWKMAASTMKRETTSTSGATTVRVAATMNMENIFPDQIEMDNQDSIEKK